MGYYRGRQKSDKTEMQTLLEFDWILEQFVNNALEVSTKDQTIHTRLQHGAITALRRYKMKALGLKPEHLPNIFKFYLKAMTE